ncbi:MAG: pyridoxamine 5'-phosphate oxidase family protein [Candidatus Eremiobacteraeota bacterium]|nr:pyridoxamine 5'-phosphate oxidase family protein [Candidatus Eremiobacteraeota bacterium]MBC5826227.1 pyridoxamine 5'-phosphate oxidase family protein [Candidatus Eremiobacteraeota bacterium]
MNRTAPTTRATVRRQSARARYDQAAIDAILDEGLVAHVGFVSEGQPYVIPMAYARDGDRLLLHGSSASRLLTTLATGAAVCATITLLDGLVVARSVFNHSMNYRSVVIFGRARALQETDEKRSGLKRITEHLVQGRWNDARQPSETELSATSVMSLPLEEVSVKIRGGPPVDAPADYASSSWAGVIPIQTVFEAPLPDPKLGPSVAAPVGVTSYHRPTKRT